MHPYETSWAINHQGRHYICIIFVRRSSLIKSQNYVLVLTASRKWESDALYNKQGNRTLNVYFYF